MFAGRNIEGKEVKIKKSAYLITMLMGLGHVRAAFPLRFLSGGEIIEYGSELTTFGREKLIWKIIRRIYYLVSKAGDIPSLGKTFLLPILRLEEIESYYPVKDLSKPSLVVKVLDFLIRNNIFCGALIKKIKDPVLPVINTFYATAIAIDRLSPEIKNNFLVICDADINRIWVAKSPEKSMIKYLVPCTNVKKRLTSYGVPEKNIFITGFPLPMENIGSPERLEILKEDLLRRLIRLDPSGKFLSYHKQSVQYHLGKEWVPDGKSGYFTVTFAIGGAGAQTHILKKALISLKKNILAGSIKINISVGIQRKVLEKVLGFINNADLNSCINKGINIVYDIDVNVYIIKFNKILRETDVLWTKPSELSFYCALGIPILIANPIGAHEDMNRRWLQEIHAGIEPPGSEKYVNEWLYDLRENGRLAEAAWDGFLKARKLGTYKIEQLVVNGSFKQNQLPLEQ